MLAREIFTQIRLKVFFPIAIVFMGINGFAQDSTIPGEVFTPYPTIINLAIGGPTGGVNWGDYGAGNPYAADIIDPGIHSDFDYDAVGTFEAGEALPHYGPRQDNKLIFEDNFSQGLDNWVVEKFDRDVVDVRHSGSQMKVTTKKGVDGVMIWCKHSLPENFMVEYDFIPGSETGFFLMFFCVEKDDQTDILEHMENKFTTSSLFEKYTNGEINGYHISYRRNDNPTCNLRKNPGEQTGILLKQQSLSGILSSGNAHHVVLKKSGRHIRLEVDQKEFMTFADDGTIGGYLYSGGRFGFRQVYDSEGYYDNFRIWDMDTHKKK